MSAETSKAASEQVVKEIRRSTRKQYSAEEKIRVVLDGLRGEYSIAELRRCEGIAESLYYSWSKEFLEAERRLAGIRRGPPPPMRSRVCAVRPRNSRRSSLSRGSN